MGEVTSEGPIPKLPAESLRDSILSLSNFLHIAGYSITSHATAHGAFHQSIERIIGEPVSRIWSRPEGWLHYIHPHDRQYALDHLAQVVPGGSFDISYRVRKSDGTEVRVRDVGLAVPGESGTVHHYDGLIWEIKHAVLSEFGVGSELTLNDALLRAVPDLWLVFDRNAVLLDGRAGSLLKPLFQLDEILGKQARDFLPPELAESVEKLVIEASEAPFEYNLADQNGIGRWFEARFSRIEHDRCLVVIRDIHDRKMAEAALASRASILSAIRQCAELFLETFDELPLNRVAELIGQASDVDRCFVFMNPPRTDGGPLLYRQVAEWCRPGIDSQWDNEHLFDLAYDEVGFHDIARQLSEGKVLSLSPADLEEPARSIIAGQGIVTLFLAPIFVGGQWWGFFGFDECVRRRDWTDEEKETLAGAAAMIGLGLGRQKSQKELFIREQKFQVLFENSPSPIFIVEISSQKILEVNPAGSILFALLEHSPLGLPVASLIDDSVQEVDGVRFGPDVRWFRMKEGLSPFRIKQTAIDHFNSHVNAWFLQPLQEQFLQERDSLIKKELLTAMAVGTSAIVSETLTEEGIRKMLLSLVSTRVITAAYLCPLDEQDIGVAAICDASRLASLTDAQGCREFLDSLLKNQAVMDLLHCGQISVQQAPIGEFCSELQSLSPTFTIVCPIMCHGLLHSVLLVSWLESFSQFKDLSALNLAAGAISRRIESQRGFDLSSSMLQLAAQLSSCEDLSKFGDLSCKALVDEYEIEFAAVYERPHDRNAFNLLSQRSKSGEVPEVTVWLPEKLENIGNAEDSIRAFLNSTFADSAWPGVNFWLVKGVMDEQGQEFVVLLLRRPTFVSSRWPHLVIGAATSTMLTSYRAMRARLDSNYATNKLNWMMQSSKLLYVTLDGMGRILDLNSYAHDLFEKQGFSIQSGDNLQVLLDDSDSELLSYVIDSATKFQRSTLSLELRSPSGHITPVEGHVARSSAADSIFEFVATDLTEKRASRMTLMLLKECYNKTVTPSLVTRIENDRVVLVEANTAFLKEFAAGRSFESLQDKPILDCFGDYGDEIRSRILNSGNTSIQINRVSSGGWYECQITQVTLSWSSKPHHVWLFNDLTREKEAANELTKALLQEQKLHELKSRLIATTSHEFRTPLEVIASSVDLIQRYSGKWDGDKVQKFLTRILSSVSRMTEMIESVLELEKQTIGQSFEQALCLPLEPVIQETLEELEAAHPGWKVLQVEYRGKSKPIWGDAQSVRLILANILTNARKYSAGLETVRFQVIYEVLHVTLIVEDQGIGIPACDLATIFDPFCRGSNTQRIPGTGIGLAIVKSCVEKLNGRINIASEANHGTRIEVQLPVTSPTLTSESLYCR